MSTLIAGFANGTIGIWSLENGRRLLHERLHGPVAHLLIHYERLYAASTLGQHSVLDLSDFYRDHCELLREVWQRVPVTWESGIPRLRPPPEGLECSQVAEPSTPG